MLPIINLLSKIRNITLFLTPELKYHHVSEKWFYQVSSKNEHSFFEVEVSDLSLYEIDNISVSELKIQLECYAVSKSDEPQRFPNVELQDEVKVKHRSDADGGVQILHFQIRDVEAYSDLIQNLKNAKEEKKYLLFIITGLPSKNLYEAAATAVAKKVYNLENNILFQNQMEEANVEDGFNIGSIEHKFPKPPRIPTPANVQRIGAEKSKPGGQQTHTDTTHHSASDDNSCSDHGCFTPSDSESRTPEPVPVPEPVPEPEPVPVVQEAEGMNDESPKKEGEISEAPGTEQTFWEKNKTPCLIALGLSGLCGVGGAGYVYYRVSRMGEDR